MNQSQLSHSATALVEATAEAAFAFLADPIALGGWSLGCMDTRATETTSVYTGHSLFDGAQGWFAIDAHPEVLLIDYRVGPKDALRPRISARVVRGAVVGHAEDHCLVTLLAWRTSDMSDERWRRLCATHEVEIWLIKAQIETQRGDV